MENNKKLSKLKEFKALFEKQDYDGAIKFLDENKQNFDEGVYQYNLGLTYLKKGQLVEARVLFEKSKLNGFFSNEVDLALKEATSGLEVKTLEESSSFSDDFNNIVLQIPFDVYFLISLIFVAIVIGFYKKLDKYIRIIIFVFAMLPTVFYYQHVNQHEKIVVLEDQYVYRGPSKMFEQIQMIPKGMKLFTGKDHNGWRYIVTPQSHRGWFKSEKVESL